MSLDKDWDIAMMYGKYSQGNKLEDLVTFRRVDLAAYIGQIRSEYRLGDAAPVAIMDTREALSLCAPAEADFPGLYALQGRRVALLDLGPNVEVTGRTLAEKEK